MFKVFISAAAIALTLGAFYPYIRGILNNRVKPHIFSWGIWGTTTMIVFLAQLEAKAGAGAWVIGVSACITFGIAVMAFLKRADSSITRTDRVFFAAALSSLPIWFLTDDPLWAVVVLTTVDLLGFGPTLRKAYDEPHTESLPFFGLFLIRNLLIVLALETYTVTTLLFPVAVAMACLSLMLVIACRRRLVSAGHAAAPDPRNTPAGLL